MLPVPILIEAIAREEGFYEVVKVPNRPQRNNNPGDLEWHFWMSRFGAMKGDPRFAVFPTVDDGFAALRHLFTFYGYKGKTIAEAIAEFAPAVENKTQSYIDNVVKWTKLTSDTIIDEYI